MVIVTGITFTYVMSPICRINWIAQIQFQNVTGDTILINIGVIKFCLKHGI